jgi:hypothetical protein
MAVLNLPVVLQLRGGKKLAIRPIPSNDVPRPQPLSSWLWSDGICTPFLSQLIDFQNDRVGLFPFQGELNPGFA